MWTHTRTDVYSGLIGDCVATVFRTTLVGQAAESRVWHVFVFDADAHVIFTSAANSAAEGKNDAERYVRGLELSAERDPLHT